MTAERYSTEAPFDKDRRDGAKVCRWCGGPVPKPRRTFCSEECLTQYSIRSGFSTRNAVWERDNGMCALCGIDTTALQVCLHSSNDYEEMRRDQYLRAIGMSQWSVGGRVRFYDVHHVRLVKDGGGICGLENLITVCMVCHRNIHAHKIDLQEALKSPPCPQKREEPWWWAPKKRLPLFEAEMKGGER